MLFRLIKKITKNLGVFLSLFFGIILSLVIINGIAIYGNSLSDVLFQKEIANYEQQFNENGGVVSLSYKSTDTELGFSDEVLNYNKSIFSDFDYDVEEGRSMALAEESAFWREDANINKLSFFYYTEYELIAIKDFENHVDIVEGRMFNNSYRGEDKNVLEVVVDSTTLFNFDLKVGELYGFDMVDYLTPTRLVEEIENSEELGLKKKYIKVVGVYEFKENDLFWRKGKWNNNYNHFVANQEALSTLCNDKGKILNCSTEYFIDLSTFKYVDSNKFIKQIDDMRNSFNSVNTLFSFNLYNLLLKENNDMKLVNNMLWIIQIPLLVIVFLYILMITGIIVERDKDEIALLKSRGATRIKILVNYLFDGMVIVAVGGVIAPLLSLELAKYMSLTNGFLKFDGQVSNNLYFCKTNLYLSLIAGITFLTALILPVIKASKEGVVHRKQSKVRIKISSWKKTFIDFILIGIAIYGFRSFNNTKEIASNVNIDINSIALDPVVFISATILTFGLSLFFLRIYPYIIKFIFKFFKNIMPAHIFVSFSNLGRKVGKREYTMLFIMITISTGIFNLKIARTINTNVIDNIKYTNGTQIKMAGTWNKEKRENFNINRETYTAADQLMGRMDILEEVTNFIEPDFSQYRELESIEGTTKVLKVKYTNLKYSDVQFKNTKMVAVVPDEYGKVAWMREDLTPIHWYNYLNVLSAEPGAIFLSSNMKETYDSVNLKPGNLVDIEIDGFSEKFVFGGYVDYWPEYKDKNELLVIGNFNYVYSKLARKPYEIWAKLKDGKTYDDLINEIKEKDINVAGIRKVDMDANESIYLKAINSSITISFILSMFITLVGFLIYWCICIKERELQFGILRSLGLKIRKIYNMIFVEQILVTGTALLIGVITGKAVSSVFLPIITRLVFGNQLAIPVYDYITKHDYFLILGIFIVSVVFVLAIILRYVSKIKIDQAIKIGED